MPVSSKPVTIRDVARKAGVGVGTVSRVLNDNPQVSEATRQKVASVIQELDFHPSEVARRLSRGRSLAIGVIAPFFTRPAFVGRLEGIQAVLAQSEYDLILYNVETPEQSAKLLQSIPREGRVDGLIVVTLRPSDDDVERFNRSGVPVVLVDSDHPDLSSVVIDDVSGGRQATQHLVDLGHRRIAYISDYLESPFGFQASSRRQAGYRAVLIENGLVPDQDYHRQGEHGRHPAYRMAEELLNLDEPPTAIFAASDTQALGVLEAIDALGLRVPDDISVVGYDDIEIAAYLGLTTMHQPMYHSGEEGINALLQSLTNGPSTAPLLTTLPVHLVERETTGSPAQ